MAKGKEFPEYVYVTRESEGAGEDEYLAAHEVPVDLAEKGEAIRYGVYKLASVNEITLRPNIKHVK